MVGEPTSARRSGQDYRLAREVGEFTDIFLDLSERVGPAVGLAEQGNRGIEVVDAEYDVFDSADWRSLHAGRSLDAPGARRLVFDDERQGGTRGARAYVGGHPLDRHAVGALAAATLGSRDGNAGLLQAIRFLQQHVGAHRPGAGDRIVGHVFRPVGTDGPARLYWRNQLQVSPVVEADTGHLGNAVAVGTTEVWSQAHIGKGLAKRVEIRTADGRVVEFQHHGLAFLSHGRLGDE